MRRTRRCEQIKPDLLVIGLDVAKSVHVAVAVASNGAQSKPMKFAVSRDGFTALEAFAANEVRRCAAAGWVAAFEPTAHYATTVVDWLSSRGVAVFSVHPSHTSRAKSLYDGTSRKTDAKDALVIASLCRQGLCVPCRHQSGPHEALRILAAQRHQLTKKQTQTMNRLHRHVDVLFPELGSVFKWFEGRALMWVVSTIPAPVDVLARTVPALADEMNSISSHQLGTKYAQALHAAAQRSIGTRQGLAGHRLAVKQLVTELELVKLQLQQIEHQMAELLLEIPYAAKLGTIPSLGTVTVATLLGELGDLKRYRHPRQLIAMAGLDLVENSSGTRKGRHHISRRGRGYARQILYLAALRLRWHQRRAAEDRKREPKKKAVVATMARLLRVMFAIARDDVSFDPSRLIATTDSEAA